MFGDSNCETALLVDVTNTFNCVYCQAALYNISILCSAFSAINCTEPAHLLVVVEAETVTGGYDPAITLY